MPREYGTLLRGCLMKFRVQVFRLRNTLEIFLNTTAQALRRCSVRCDVTNCHPSLIHLILPQARVRRWWFGRTDSASELTFEQPGLARLTLIDVALALFAIRSIDPNYQFDYHNCWWYSRSTLLLLMRISQPNAEVAVVEDRFVSVARFPSVLIPGGLNNGIILRDGSSAHTKFTELVSFHILVQLRVLISYWCIPQSAPRSMQN